MRFLGRALAALFAVGVFLVAIAWFLPREVTVTREIVIAAPPARVFAHLNSMQKMAEWSPWTRLDPAMRTSFAGPPEGTGNRMTWSSDDPAVGSGSQEIIVSEPDQRVETSLQLGDMGPATAWLALRPEDGGTHVTWGILADVGASPVGRYMGLALDRWIGADFEAGLASLKELAERG